MYSLQPPALQKAVDDDDEVRPIEEPGAVDARQRTSRNLKIISLAHAMVQPRPDSDMRKPRIPEKVTTMLNSVKIKDWDLAELEKLDKDSKVAGILSAFKKMKRRTHLDLDIDADRIIDEKDEIQTEEGKLKAIQRLRERRKRAEVLRRRSTGKKGQKKVQNAGGLSRGRSREAFLSDGEEEKDGEKPNCYQEDEVLGELGPEFRKQYFCETAAALENIHTLRSSPAAEGLLDQMTLRQSIINQGEAWS